MSCPSGRTREWRRCPETNRFLAGCHRNGGKYCRLPGPRIWTRRRRDHPGLRNQNSPRLPRWKLTCVAGEEGNPNSFGAVLVNDALIQRSREGKHPFPDGTIIATLHYRHSVSEDKNKLFGRKQSFIAGLPLGERPMTRAGRAVEEGESQGFLRILVDAGTKEILCAAILGSGGDEAIHCTLDVIYSRSPYSVLQRAVHIHGISLLGVQVGGGMVLIAMG